MVIRRHGELVAGTLSSLRLSYFGKGAHRISASAASVALLEGYTDTFRVLGGMPTGEIDYDIRLDQRSC